MKKLSILFVVMLAMCQATIIHAEEVKLTAGDAAADDNFSTSVAISGNYAIVGAPGNDDDGDRSGSAYIFFLDGGVWAQQAKLTAKDGAGGDFFGRSVSIDGDWAIVSSHHDDIWSGSAYIYQRDGKNWKEHGKLDPDDGEANDSFGFSVDISGDTAIAGVPQDNDKGADSGSVFVYVRVKDKWVEEQKFTPRDAEGGDIFGSAVSIDGDYAIIGALWDDDKGNRSGSAYIYKRVRSVWQQEAKLTASDGARNAEFGFSVHISGKYAIVGAYGHNSGTGAAYVFVRNGEKWAEEAKLTASDGQPKDDFGISVSINGTTGNIGALVGSYRHDAKGSNSGAVYSFLRKGGAWVERAKITASDVEASERFGVSVSLSANHGITGSSLKNGGTGAAYIYNAFDLALPVEPLGKQVVLWGQIRKNALYQNFPNPFNPETWIPYQLAKDAFVTLTISDLTGYVVRTFKVGHQPAAMYTSKERAIYWNGRNDTGEPVSSGIYFYHLRAGDFATTKKMIIIK